MTAEADELERKNAPEWAALGALGDNIEEYFRIGYGYGAEILDSKDNPATPVLKKMINELKERGLWYEIIIGVVADTSRFNSLNLPSFRGEDAFFTPPFDLGDKRTKIPNTQNLLKLITSPFKQMGKGDWFPFIANLINSVLLVPEFLLQVAGRILMLPYQACRGMYNGDEASKSPARKRLWGTLAALTWLVPCVASFSLSLAGKALGYTRAVLDGVATLLNPRVLFSRIAGLVNKEIEDAEDAERIPPLTSMTAILKNGLRLAVVGAAVVGTIFLAPLLPVAIPVLAAATPAASAIATGLLTSVLSFGALFVNGAANALGWKINPNRSGSRSLGREDSESKDSTETDTDGCFNNVSILRRFGFVKKHEDDSKSSPRQQHMDNEFLNLDALEIGENKEESLKKAEALLAANIGKFSSTKRNPASASLGSANTVEKPGQNAKKTEITPQTKGS